MYLTLLIVFQAKQSIPVMASDNYHSVVSEQSVVRHQSAVNAVWSDAQLLAKEWSDLVVRYKEMRMRNNMR
jgi:3-methyladenine DNA glycosylase Tag